jgi:hypothetical protein
LAPALRTSRFQTRIILASENRGTVAKVLAETLVGAIWPTPLPSTGLLKDYDALCEAAELLLEPQELLLKMINAFARAAALPGFGPLAAALIGQLAENLCREFLLPSPDSQAAGDMVMVIDIDLYAQDVQLAECPALRGLAIEQVADMIGKLLESPPGRQPAKPLRTVQLSPGPSPSRVAGGRSGKAVVGSEPEGGTPGAEESGARTDLSPDEQRTLDRYPPTDGVKARKPRPPWPRRTLRFMTPVG